MTDWKRVAYLMHVSRALDDIEQTRLLPERKVLYQFCARGHELGQVLLGLNLTDPHDGVGLYYRSRPLMLALGVSPEDLAAGPLMRAGSCSGGRDVGVMFNKPSRGSVTVLPTAGGVGTQYTPSTGWAQAIAYRHLQLKDSAYAQSIGVVHGGEASVATNGFWSALTIATTQRLPLLFYIEDNGYGISVTSDHQTPGANIAQNLQSFSGLAVLQGEGNDPKAASDLIQRAVQAVRTERTPTLLRLRVPRLSGHSGQDTQAYKSAERLADELARDPMTRLVEVLNQGDLKEISDRARHDVERAVEAALAQAQPKAESATTHVFFSGAVQEQGGGLPEGVTPPAGKPQPVPEATRINMLTAIRRTLDVELSVNPRAVIFGEDVGPKGGVHGATLGLQDKHGRQRVFDTSLSEEGIIGRSVGMALAGLLPIPEIQFRKYAEPATEQLTDCGSMRWRTINRFAAPMVVRMPGGFFKCGDPWHSMTNEVAFVHSVGWRVAVPSNAEDAVGLLRTALRGNDPTIFFEHRAMLDSASARRPYPGDDYVIPFGKARIVRPGDELTIVTWGAMVERCEQAAEASAVQAEVIDLRTLSPWDRDAVLESVRRTRRCLIVHEDTMSAGFGAEIAAVLARDAFFDLDAPIERLTMPDVPSPHNPLLLEAVVPSVDQITRTIQHLASI